MAGLKTGLEDNSYEHQILFDGVIVVVRFILVSHGLWQTRFRA
jgi:hypothetical protein